MQCSPLTPEVADVVIFYPYSHWKPLGISFDRRSICNIVWLIQFIDFDHDTVLNYKNMCNINSILVRDTFDFWNKLNSKSSTKAYGKCYTLKRSAKQSFLFKHRLAFFTRWIYDKIINILSTVCSNDNVSYQVID